jgi:hypothetical protein
MAFTLSLDYSPCFVSFIRLDKTKIKFLIIGIVVIKRPVIVTALVTEIAF